MIINYNDIYYNYSNTTLKGKLKPISCKSCQDNGNAYCGLCENCLKNQAYNQEYIETHSFIMDKQYRQYHDGGHNAFKSLVLRLPDEHPYLYYGIEVEVEFDSDWVRVYEEDDYYDEDDCDGDNSDIQGILNEFSRITEGMFVYEHDGSLDNGVECISRPTSYRYWTHPDTVKRLQEGFEYLRKHGAMINQPDTNGLHIHISRKFFDYGNTKLENRQEAYTGFDWLFQKFQPEMEKICGRKYTHYCEAKADKLKRSLMEDNYTMRMYNVEAEIKCKLKKGGELPRGDHYSAVNLTDHTIETRVFKSSTDYKEILSYIELVRNIAHTVREENIKRSLDDILHTKDNLYLDEHIRKVKMNCRRNKEELDLDKVNDDEIEIVVKQSGNR